MTKYERVFDIVQHELEIVSKGNNHFARISRQAETTTVLQQYVSGRLRFVGLRNESYHP